MSNTPKRGRAAFWLFELQEIAPTVICDLTRHAVALREQAAEATDLAVRDELRYEAEGVVIQARAEISKVYGDTQLADDVEDMVQAAVSAVRMP